MVLVLFFICFVSQAMEHSEVTEEQKQRNTLISSLALLPEPLKTEAPNPAEWHSFFSNAEGDSAENKTRQSVPPTQKINPLRVSGCLLKKLENLETARQRDLVDFGN